MLWHAVPSSSQRCHCRANAVGVGDQVPFVADNSSPTCAVPLSAGLTLFVGPPFADTVSVGCDGAAVFPSALPAVTITRIACETSGAVTAYVFSVAPDRSPHAVPSLAHRCHW